MATEKVSSAKPHIYIATLGHIDHGKTTLTSAITKVLSESGDTPFQGYDEINKAPDRIVDDIKISVSLVAYQTANRRYTHSDCPGNTDYAKGMITDMLRMDGAILVVEAEDGLMPQAREQIVLARQAGVPALVVFINKVDEAYDDESVEFLEAEIRELLSFYGFPGNDIPVIKGAALAALNGRDDEIGKNAIIDLLAAMDDYIPLPKPPLHLKDRPFLMPIEHMLSMSGVGTIATGRIETGTVKVNDALEIVGSVPTFKTSVIDIDVHDKTRKQAKAGENIAPVLRDVKREDFADSLGSGLVLAAAGSVKAHSTFDTAVYLLTKEEGGRGSPISSGYDPHFRFYIEDIVGSIELPTDTEKVMPGYHFQTTVELIFPVAMTKGQRFDILEGGRTIGKGLVGTIVK